MILVTLHDSKAGTWTPPHAVNNPAVAIREFEALVKDQQKTLVSQHPSDFSIWQIGDWSERDGFVTGLEASKFIKLCSGSDFAKDENA